MAKVAVIGAGHGGLAVAARLKVKGHEVTVFESSDQVVTLDESLTLPAAYRDFFLKTGSSLESNLELVEVQVATQVALANNQTLNLPGSGLGRVISEIESKLGNSAANQWRTYSQITGQLWQSTRAALVENQLTQNIRKTIGFSNFWNFRNFSSLLMSNFSHPALIDLAQSYQQKCWVTSDTKIGILALNSYVEQIFGVYKPVGGMAQLSQALQKRCVKLGVNFEFSTKVNPVELGDQIIGIEVDSGKFQAADFVVVNDTSKISLQLNWRSQPSYETKFAGLFVINETSWLGIGPAHAVLGAQIVAQAIGSASN